jgi:hypothetical protein
MEIFCTENIFRSQRRFTQRMIAENILDSILINNESILFVDDF